MKRKEKQEGKFKVRVFFPWCFLWMFIAGNWVFFPSDYLNDE